MAALAADVGYRGSVGPIGQLQVPCSGADIFYAGAVLWIDHTSGGATVGQGQVASIAAGDRIMGIIPERQETTAAGQMISVIVSGLVWLPLGSSIGANDVGEFIGYDADGTLSDNPSDSVGLNDLTIATNDAVLGRLKVAESARMLVMLDGNTGSIYVATALYFA